LPYDTEAWSANAFTVPVPAPSTAADHASLPTLESISPARRKEAAPNGPERTSIVAQSPTLASSSPPPPQEPPLAVATPETPVQDVEEEASQQGAFNEATGEINWDCPCLGGMAHGPCGEHFRGAFSCFVYSKEEPKGMDCIEHFKTMQTCFRDHPDIYGGELDDDDEEVNEDLPLPPVEVEPAPADAASNASSRSQSPSQPESAYRPSSDAGPSAPPAQPTSPPTPSFNDDAKERAQVAERKVTQEGGEPTNESDELVPKAALDAS